MGGGGGSSIAETHTSNKTRDVGKREKVGNGDEWGEIDKSRRRLSVCREDGVKNNRRKVKILEKTLRMEWMTDVLEQDGL